MSIFTRITVMTASVDINKRKEKTSNFKMLESSLQWTFYQRQLQSTLDKSL